jgi:uncharacterized protein YukE
MAPTFKRRLWRPTTSILLGVLVVVLVIAWRWQPISDWFRLRNYQPPAAISALASDDAMTDYAQHIYYLNHPQIEPKTTFTNYCPAGTEQTVVLGCHRNHENGIYILGVTTPELAGIEQVTAAHEMLHGAYERLSIRDQQQVDAMLMDYYDHGIDPATKQIIDAYKSTEPNELVNEMHSIFGTQVAHLPKELEQYYGRYFTNRAVVTGYYAKYQQAFTGRQAQIKQYDDQLQVWKTEIDQRKTDLQNEQAALQSQRSALDAYRAKRDYVAYNNGVSSYNQAVTTYNNNLAQLKSLIDQYNQTVAKRNAIAFEEQSLVKDITTPSVKARQ